MSLDEQWRRRHASLPRNPTRLAESEEQKDMSLDVMLRWLGAAYQTVSGETVTPDNCERAPTVKAIVEAVSNRFAVLPVGVYQKTTSNGRDSKEKLPNHPVARLLRTPSENSTSADFWADAASTLVRHRNFYAYKGRGQTGPILFLDPIPPRAVSVTKNDYGAAAYTVTLTGGQQAYARRQMVHVRGTARDFLIGDPVVTDIQEAIAAEIAAEKFGASFFGNGALPLTYFKYLQGAKGFRTTEEQKDFVDSFQKAYSGEKRFKAMLLPVGMDVSSFPVDNDKAQFNETRNHLRTVICGAFNFPLHMAGDLANGHYNNVEQQDTDFTQNVILPYVRLFEAALERDLLTEEDRRGGIIIRFNLDAVQRADLQTRSEANTKYISAGVLSPNEVREREGLNPISEEDGGDSYRIPAGVTMAGQGNSNVATNGTVPDQSPQ